MANYNPRITRWYNPLYTLNIQVFFITHLYTRAPSQTYLGVMLVELHGCSSRNAHVPLSPGLRIYAKHHRAPLVFEINVLEIGNWHRSSQQTNAHSCQPNHSPHQVGAKKTVRFRFVRFFATQWASNFLWRFDSSQVRAISNMATLL